MAALATAFLFGLAGVVYMSLQGSVVQVPTIVGKSLSDSKTELASLGLKLQVRASRPSTDAPDTVLEQLPRPGETVKTGQLIVVVTSKQTAQAEETPSTLKRSIEEDDTEKIEDMISDKPKKKSNSNTNKKKADTTRDVLGNTAASIANSAPSVDENSNKKDSGTEKNNEKGKDTKNPENRPQVPPAAKPTPVRPATVDRQRGNIKP